MNKQDILVLYTYNQWANSKIRTAAKNVTQEQFLAEAPYPHGGLRGTLTHILFAEWIWRNRWEGTSPSFRIRPEEFPTLESLLGRWQEEESKLIGFVESLTDESLIGPFDYKNTRAFQKRIYCGRRWHMLSTMAPSTAPRLLPCLRNSAVRPAMWI